jgi:hypothetical protein
MMPTHHADRSRKLSTPRVLAAGALVAAAVVAAFGGASLDFAKFGAPHNVALQAAQIGLGGPAQAAPIAIEGGYLPAQFPAVAGDAQPHLEAF